MKHEYLNQLRRFKLLHMAVLPEFDHLRRWVVALVKTHEDHEPTFQGFQFASRPGESCLLGVYVNYYVMMVANSYFTTLLESGDREGLPPGNVLLKGIKFQTQWWMEFDLDFRQRYSVDAFCRSLGGTPSSGPACLPIQAPAPPQGGGGTQGASGGSAGQGNAGRQGAGGGSGSGGQGHGEPSATNPNNHPYRPDNVWPHYNSNLFGQYKARGILMRTIKSKIREGALPPLPLSAHLAGTALADKTMCPSMHFNGFCSGRCPKILDHVPYTEADYQPLSDWAAANYPTSNE